MITEEKEFGISRSVVKTLVAVYEDKNHVLFTKNLYTSLKMCEWLLSKRLEPAVQSPTQYIS